MSTLEVSKGVHPFTAQFVEQSLRLSRESFPEWLSKHQSKAREALPTVKVPGRKDEEWRFIKLAPILGAGFLRPAAAPLKTTKEELSEVTFQEETAARLVFLNGLYSEELSQTDALPEGVIVTTWAEFVKNHDGEEVKEVLGSVDYWKEDLFYQINAANFEDGAVILAPKNKVVEAPIHLLFLSSGEQGRFAAHPRNVIVAGESAELTVVEEYRGLGSGEYFNNVVDEVLVGRNATLHHFKVQREGTESFHMARNVIRLQQDSNYVGTAVNFGAALSRNDSYAHYEGENIDCTLDGLAHIRGTQVSDTHTAIDHRLPSSRSYQLHKVVVDEKAHSVFNGKIFVRQDAQMTRSEQLNQNLVLSRKAHVDTKPQLEILADDVVCSHGATVGQLEEEQAFYLTSRGIDPEKARSILTYAFAAEVLETITVESLRRDLESDLMAATAQ